MAMDYRNALREIDSLPQTVSSLFGLVDRVTGSVLNARPGDVYLLFSGLMPDGVTPSHCTHLFSAL